MSVTWEIREGDCVAAMAGMPESSVDAIVTDPPYGLEFMGKDWDRLSGQPGYNERGRITDRPEAQVPYGRGGGVNSYQAGRPMQDWHEAWAREALRVLKPGGHLLAFGGTRTYHRLACAVEDAGFEIRDTIVWLYGSGFPKSLDVSKAIDKAAGAEREVVAEGSAVKRMIPGADQNRTGSWIKDNGREFVPTQTAPATLEATQWDGWGTALKPAHEPIVVARKPLVGTVAGNVLAHGTGALNIDGCRVVAVGGDYDHPGNDNRAQTTTVYGRFEREGRQAPPHEAGRWPANVVLDEEAAAMLDEQGGEARSAYPGRQDLADAYAGSVTAENGVTSIPANLAGRSFSDSGGPSRFFYCAKASSAERGDNKHPTVKPVELMRWLVRLVTPPGGLVVDPFAGSGTTGIAATRDGFSFVGIEREPEYVAIARERIRGDAPLLNTMSEREAVEA